MQIILTKDLYTENCKAFVKEMKKIHKNGKTSYAHILDELIP